MAYHWSCWPYICSKLQLYVRLNVFHFFCKIIWKIKIKYVFHFQQFNLCCVWMCRIWSPSAFRKTYVFLLYQYILALAGLKIKRYYKIWNESRLVSQVTRLLSILSEFCYLNFFILTIRISTNFEDATNHRTSTWNIFLFNKL